MNAIAFFLDNCFSHRKIRDLPDTTVSLYAILLAYLFCFLLQRQTNQSICLICHKQRNVQHIVVQLQIVQ